MKRLILTIAAVASVAVPMAAVATDASAQGRNDNRYERRDDRQDNRRDDRQDRRNDRRDYRDDRRDDRQDYRNDRRDNYRPGPQSRWDNNRYNGYYYNGRWSYGAPPAAYYGRPGYQPGYTAWRRGGYLPQSYRGYVVNDYYRYGLRAPPRGYYWYQSGNDYLLAAVATGLIFDIITR
jgi:Ni/Co efflux regulator RcnB